MHGSVLKFTRSMTRRNASRQRKGDYHLGLSRSCLGGKYEIKLGQNRFVQNLSATKISASASISCCRDTTDPTARPRSERSSVSALLARQSSSMLDYESEPWSAPRSQHCSIHPRRTGQSRHSEERRCTRNGRAAPFLFQPDASN
jgi:hypothetical protein